MEETNNVKVTAIVTNHMGFLIRKFVTDNQGLIVKLSLHN